MATIEEGPTTATPVILIRGNQLETSNTTDYLFRKDGEDFPFVEVRARRAPRFNDRITAFGPIALKLMNGQRTPFRRPSPWRGTLELTTPRLAENDRQEIAQKLAEMLFEIHQLQENDFGREEV